LRLFKLTICYMYARCIHKLLFLKLSYINYVTCMAIKNIYTCKHRYHNNRLKILSAGG